MVPDARKIDRIAYEEMLELASLGAKVLQTRSVELAMRYKVRLQVLSSFEDKPGTLVCDEEEIVESKAVSGVAYSRDEAKMTLISVADRPGIAAAIFTPLSEAGVNVDMIVQNIAEEGRTDMTFTVPRGDRKVRDRKRFARGLQDHSARWLSLQLVLEELSTNSSFLEHLARFRANAELTFLATQIDANVVHGWSPRLCAF